MAAGAVLAVVPLLTLFNPSPTVATEGPASWCEPSSAGLHACFCMALCLIPHTCICTQV